MKKFGILLLFASLLFFPELVTAGAANGLNLWFFNVIPALFPAMIITGVSMQLYGNAMKRPAVFLVLAGLLCGYPIGASCTAGLYKNNPFLPPFYQQLLPFINVTSPAFILNYVIATSLKGQYKPLILICIYLPILLFIALICLAGRKKQTVSLSGPSQEASPHLLEVLESAINSGLESILKMGAYIILCSVLCQFVLYFCKQEFLCCILCGGLEITAGIDVIAHSSFSSAVKIVMICAVCAFGGLSCAGQTRAVAGRYLNLKKYICSKFILCLFTVLWASFVTYVFL